MPRLSPGPCSPFMKARGVPSSALSSGSQGVTDPERLSELYLQGNIPPTGSW